MFRTKVNKTWNIVLRIAIVVAAVYFIYYQVFHTRDSAVLVAFFIGLEQNIFFYTCLTALFVLMILNVSLEAVKWKWLITKLEQINFNVALTAVFTGISVSMFLPNRVGDYLGRVFMLRKTDPVKGILVTIIGSIAQLITTLIAGTIALIFVMHHYIDRSNVFNIWLFIAVVIVALSFCVLLNLLYFNIQSIKPIFARIVPGWKQSIETYAVVFTLYSKKNLFSVLMLSVIRYGIFSFQFYLFLMLFGVPIPYLHAMVLIALSYFLIAIIPTIALSEIGIRGSLTIYFFSQYFAQTGLWSDTMVLAVLVASTALWLLNIALPALLGVFFVYRLKFFNLNKSK